MTLKQLNDAVTLIDNRYLAIVDTEIKEYETVTDNNNTKPVRKRVLSAIIAAVMVMLACSAVAFAINEEFRAAVISFFKIEVEDTVEQMPAENVPLKPENVFEPTEPENIAKQVEQERDPGYTEVPKVNVSRVCVPNNGYAANGLFFVCADEIEYNSGSRYEVYDMAEGELVALEQNDFSTDCTINGKNYAIELKWAENGSNIGIGYVGGPELHDGSATDGRYSVCQTFYSDGPSAVLLLEAEGSVRPIIVNLAQNTAKPVELTADYIQIGLICKAEISENGTFLLLQTLAPGSKLYCVEIATGKVVCLNELCGSEISGCGFASDTQLVCWTVTGGMSEEATEELLVRQAEGELVSTDMIDPGMIAAWLVTPAAEMVKPILTDKAATPYTNLNLLSSGLEFDQTAFSGVVCITGRYAVEKLSDGRIAVYDLAENRQSIPDNLLFPDGDCLDLIASRDGAKLLLAERNAEDGMLVCLYVLDMENDCFVNIKRDASSVGNEHRVDWFDCNTVLVDNNVYDGSGNNIGGSWYYLYKICR